MPDQPERRDLTAADVGGRRCLQCTTGPAIEGGLCIACAVIFERHDEWWAEA